MKRSEFFLTLLAALIYRKLPRKIYKNVAHGLSYKISQKMIDDDAYNVRNQEAWNVHYDVTNFHVRRYLWVDGELILTII